MKTPDLVSPYRDYFRMVSADTEALRKEVFRIRYNVYCADLKWEESSHFPNKEESDQHDQYSRHCLLQYRKDDSYIGCVRLVRANSDAGKPTVPLVEHYTEVLQSKVLGIAALPRESFGEISRLAVERKFRRRPGEQDNPGGIGTDQSKHEADERRRFPHIALGLYLGAAAFGLDEGMSGVFAMMEPRLARLLKISGIHFTQVGDIIDYRGPRAPFYITHETLLEHLRPEMKELLVAITDDLGLC